MDVGCIAGLQNDWSGERWCSYVAKKCWASKISSKKYFNVYTSQGWWIWRRNLCGFVPHTGPLFIQPPTQTTLGIPFTSRNIPDRLPRPSQGKPVSKPHAIMPEETGGNRWSYSGQVPKNEHLLMSGPLGQFDNPDCVNCPPACKNKRHFHRGSNALDNKVSPWNMPFVLKLL